MGPRLYCRQEAHHEISHVVVNCRRKPGEMQQQLHRLVITLRSFPAAVPTRPNQEYYSYCVLLQHNVGSASNQEHNLGIREDCRLAAVA